MAQKSTGLRRRWWVRVREVPSITCLAVGKTAFKALEDAKKRKPKDFSDLQMMDVEIIFIDEPKTNEKLVPE